MSRYTTKKHRSKAVPILIIIILILLGILVFLGFNLFCCKWEEENGHLYYRSTYGTRVSGWQSIDGKQLYFLPDNSLAQGWTEIDGSSYYFKEGVPASGTLTVDGRTYLFAADGRQLTGWQEKNGKISYYPEDGVLYSGITTVDNTAYLFNEAGQVMTGWLDYEGNRYYADTDGALVSGSAVIDGKRYHFNDDGILLTGFIEQDGKRYYYLEDGTIAVGWMEMDNNLYYFDVDGSMHFGWLQLGEYQYYMQEDGTAAVTPTEINGKTCYFSPKGVYIVLVNALNPIADDYDPDLIDCDNGLRISRIAAEPLQNMLSDCLAAGYHYNFIAAYRSYQDQKALFRDRYQGYMNKGMSSPAAYTYVQQTVALPGNSEHQLGLAVDITGDAAMRWLDEHCWEYGFIFRYQLDKYEYTGIANETWHFRYVGKEVAQGIRDSGLCLEEYLQAEKVIQKNN